MSLSEAERLTKEAELEHIRGVLATTERELANRDREVTAAERVVDAAQRTAEAGRLLRKTKSDDVARMAALIRRIELELS